MEEDEENNYFIYCDQALWLDRHHWWLIEVPEGLDASLSRIKNPLKTSTSENHSSEESSILFHLHCTSNQDSPLTFSLHSSDLRILKIHKFSSSLMIYLLYDSESIPTHQSSSSTSSTSLCFVDKKKDLILLGETHTVIRNEPTFPRFDSLFHEPQVTSGFKTFSQLLQDVHASPQQLQLCLLLNYYICLPHEDSPTHSLWIHFTMTDLFTHLSSFLLFLRSEGICHNSISFREAHQWVQHSATITHEQLAHHVLSHPSLVIQILLFFCDAQHISDLTFSNLFILTANDISKTYNEYIVLMRKYNDFRNSQLSLLTFHINVHKIGRIILRYKMATAHQINKTVFVASVLATFLQLCPPDLLDDLQLWNSPYHHDMYRGDCLLNLNDSDDPALDEGITHEGLFDDCHSPEFLNTVNDKILQLINPPPFHDDVYRYVNSNHLINSRFLDGVAIRKDHNLVYLYHNTLSWDWTKRLEVLFHSKTKWTQNELDIYLAPLRRLGKLSQYTVPLINDIVSRYFLKSNEYDRYGNCYYISRRLFI